MNAINSLIAIFGVTSIILSAGFSFFNRQRYKTLITDIYQPGNDELREQLKSAREDKAACEAESKVWKAKHEEQQKLVKSLEKFNSKQPDFAKLTALISDNHTEVVNKLIDLNKTIGNQSA